MDNFQEQFYQMMTRLKANQSRAAASTPKDDVMITEMINRVIVTRPAKKYQEITETSTTPQVIDLQDYAATQSQSKAGSVNPVQVNKMKVINDFIRSNGRI